MIDIVRLKESISIKDYERITFLSRAVSEMRDVVIPFLPDLKDRTIWMINSTEQGGGVAEMLPRLISLMGDLGLDVRWAVIKTDRKPFFRLTKNIHNLIHDSGEMTLGDEERRVYEAVNRENAESLKAHLKPGDVLVVHDPQPLPLGQMLKAEMDIHTLWRCHIGLKRATDRTHHAWGFLRPYMDGYDRVAFSAHEYVPEYLLGRHRIIHPAIDPLNHKNRELDPVKMMGVMCNADLVRPHQPLVTPPFDHTARRLRGDGTFASATEPDEIGFLYRPMVTQISRWDRLKGFLPLMKGFAKMKRRAVERSDDQWPSERHKRRMAIVRLALGGPDPGAIQDDPEGIEVIEELKAVYCSLPEEVQNDIAILALPMESRKENALMVNVLQRVSSVVFQNSIQEGFGLTVTEAMWKRRPVLASNAGGILEQIEDGTDGCINPHPEDEDEIAEKLEWLLLEMAERERFGKNAQRKVYDKFLVFNQVAQWVRNMGEVVREAAQRG